MNTENITGSLKPTSKTAPFQLLLACVVLALLLPLIYPLAANGILPASDAATTKVLFFDTFRAALPVILGGSAFSTLLGSNAKTLGKVVAQLAPGVVTDATPGGEGIGAKASDDTTGDLNEDNLGGVQDEEAGK